jgi:hypothetical protein
VQKETAQLMTDIVCGYGVVEAPPFLQVGWSDCINFLLSSSFTSFAHLEFPSEFFVLVRVLCLSVLI